MKPLFTALLLSSLLLVGCTKKEETPRSKRIVYVDMVADMFHPGHVAFLKQAREHGDYLIVGLNSDEDAMSYKRQPIMTLKERATMVRSCRYVDEVIEACPLVITDELIDEHQVSVVIHGDDFNPNSLRTYYGVAIDRGIFKTVPYTPGVSTSDILKRILKRGDSLLDKKTDTGSPVQALSPSDQP